jgi:hypothetical protein
MDIKLKKRISCDLDSLDNYNKKYPWIPSRFMIRPTPENLEFKIKKIKEIESEWNSYFDFILYHVFKENYFFNNENKKQILNYENLDLPEYVFLPSDFPYQITENTNHYVLWNSKFNINYDFNDNIINDILYKKIKEIVNNNNFDFVWYKNPKPTIPEFYHIQVFWIKIL